jgi:hypothetical protein
MQNSFLKYQSPIPVSRNTSIGEAILSSLEPDGSQISVIKLPAYLNLEDEVIQVKPIGKLLYIESEESQGKSEALSGYLRDNFANHIASVEYSLGYNWIVEMYHLMSLDHIKSTHWLTLNGFSIDNLRDYQETSNTSEISYDVELPNSLDAFRINSSDTKKSIVTLTLFSAFTVGMRLKIKEDWIFLILFNVLPTADKSHKLFVDYYSSKEIRFKFLTRQIIKLVSLITVFEDIDYLNIISKRNLSRVQTKKPSLELQNNSLIKRFYNLYSKHF